MYISYEKEIINSYLMITDAITSYEVEAHTSNVYPLEKSNNRYRQESWSFIASR